MHSGCALFSRNDTDSTQPCSPCACQHACLSGGPQARQAVLQMPRYARYITAMQTHLGILYAFACMCCQCLLEHVMHSLARLQQPQVMQLPLSAVDCSRTAPGSFSKVQTFIRVNRACNTMTAKYCAPARTPVTSGVRADLDLQYLTIDPLVHGGHLLDPGGRIPLHKPPGGGL